MLEARALLDKCMELGGEVIPFHWTSENVDRRDFNSDVSVSEVSFYY